MWGIVTARPSFMFTWMEAAREYHKNGSRLVLCALTVASLDAQRGQGGRGGAPAAPAKDTVAPGIPGVVAAGTPVTVIKEGFQGTEGPIAMPDGSLLFTEPAANRISRIDRDNHVTMFLENTNGSNALAFDAKGRLISVQTTAGQMRVGVLYPKGSEATLAALDVRPNDLVVDKKGGVYFTSPGATPQVFYVPCRWRRDEGSRGHHESQRHSAEPRREDALCQRYARRISDRDRCPARRHARDQRNFAKYEGVQKTDAGVDERRRRLAVDNDGRVYAAKPARRRAGVQPEGPAPGHDSPVTLAAEPRVLGSRQEDALHRRPKRRVEGSDVVSRLPRPRQVTGFMHAAVVGPRGCVGGLMPAKPGPVLQFCTTNRVLVGGLDVRESIGYECRPRARHDGEFCRFGRRSTDTAVNSAISVPVHIDHSG